MSRDQLVSTQSIPKQPSAHSRAANARKPIPHASWELGCAIGAMVSLFIITGVFAIVVMESLPSFMQKCLHSFQASVVTLVTCCQAGIVALVLIVLPLSMRRRLCHCRDGSCRSHHNGIVAISDAQSSPPLSS